MRYLGLVFLLFVVAGCGIFPSQSGYRNKVNAMIGQQEEDLLKEWGPPASSYEVDGMKFVKYKKEKSTYNYPRTENRKDGSRIYTSGYTTYSSCTTTFSIMSTFIIGVSFDGNACVD